MSPTGRRAKLLSGLLGPRSAATAGGSDIVSIADHDRSEALAAALAIPVSPHAHPPEQSSSPDPDAEMNGQRVLLEKGSATPLAFQPPHWSYGGTPESEGSGLSLGSVSTTKVDVARALSAALPLEEITNAVVSTPVAGDPPTVEDRAAQQALAASLAEIIDSILRTRQFAIRGMHEAFRKQPVTPTPPVEHPATAENTASVLRTELARAKADPDAEARLTRPVIHRMLGFVGLGDSAADPAAADPA